MKAEIYASFLLCQVIPQTGTLKKKKSLPKFKLSGYLGNKKKETETVKNYFIFFFFFNLRRRRLSHCLFLTLRKTNNCKFRTLFKKSEKRAYLPYNFRENLIS